MLPVSTSLHTCLIPLWLAGRLVQLTELCISTVGHTCQIYRRKSTCSPTLAPLVRLSGQSWSTSSWVCGFAGGLSRLVRIIGPMGASIFMPCWRWRKISSMNAFHALWGSQEALELSTISNLAIEMSNVLPHLSGMKCSLPNILLWTRTKRLCQLTALWPLDCCR